MMAKVASTGKGRIRLKEQENKLTLVVAGIAGTTGEVRLTAAAGALQGLADHWPTT
jgi:hypothetical protein